MFFTDAKELQQIFPNSDIKKIDPYLPGLCDEEINSLLPIVGEALLAQLNDDYQEVNTEFKTLWLREAQGSFDSRKLSILYAAQKVCAYSYFANNIALMSVRLNIGGGANVAYTDGYDAPDEKQAQRLDKELWHQSLRAKEQLLFHLEQDAKGEQIYTELWKQSEYFYLHSNLLFTTASELHPHYMSLGTTQPRLNFINSIHIQEQCNTYYIIGTIGEKLLQALIDQKYNRVVEEGEEPLSESTLAIWRKLNHLVRVALASFMKYEMSDKKEAHVLNLANTQLTLAETYIKEHPEQFAEYSDKPAPPAPGPDDKPKPHPHPHHHHDEKPVFNLLS